jgi:phosphate transport system substrate-binding protein
MITLPLLLALSACGEGPIVLQVKGSDTMVSLMQKLSEAYLTVNPRVVVAVTGGGTGTGVKSLLDGTTDMANASRAMKGEELELAEKKGIHPVENVLAFDGLAIYVHADNPIAALSFEDLKCIYSADGACKSWSDLGVPLDCGEIQKVGRQNNSGTYEYFREEILGKDGKFTNTMDQSGTQQVVDVVATQKCAIGYGGMGYRNPSARFVCLSKTRGAPCSEPSIENVKSKAYDFSRPLFVYTNGAALGEVAAFLDWSKGPAGQKIVLEAGFVPL